MLNRQLPVNRYVTLPTVDLGDRAEADVGVFALPAESSLLEGSGNAVRQPFSTPDPLATFLPRCQAESHDVVKTNKDDMKLVAAIELISPRNLDRPEKIPVFARKCHSYLKHGLGLILVHVVTYRKKNLHNQLMEFLGGPPESLLASKECFVSAYRWSDLGAGERLDSWHHSVVVGQILPSLPLFLKDGPCVMIDLEATYTEALADLNL
jgi:hypothetical protein